MPRDKTGTIYLSCIFSEVIVSVGLRRKEVGIITRRTLLSRRGMANRVLNLLESGPSKDPVVFVLDELFLSFYSSS